MAETIELAIHALGARGDGIADWRGRRVFAPFCLPGEIVRARLVGEKGQGALEAELVETLSPSEDRIAPVCRHFGACGGCALQHMRAEAYAGWKRDLVTQALARRGISGDGVAVCKVTPPASRRIAKPTLRRVNDGVLIGFNARASHRIVNVTSCPVLTPNLEAAIDLVRQAFCSALESVKAASLTFLQTENGVDLLIAAGSDLRMGDRLALTKLAEDGDFARVSWLKEESGEAPDPVLIRRPSILSFGDVPVIMPPGSFVQATEFGGEALTSFVVSRASGAKRVADLFSGSGAFTFSLARFSQVHSVDADAAAMGAAQSAANRASGLKSITFETRNLFKRPLAGSELRGLDAVIFDPPRAGAKEQAEALAASNVPLVIAVSCDPATFARDARILLDGGYRLEAVQPVDQFLWSPHVELAAAFRRAG